MTNYIEYRKMNEKVHRRRIGTCDFKNYCYVPPPVLPSSVSAEYWSQMVTRMKTNIVVLTIRLVLWFFLNKVKHLVHLGNCLNFWIYPSSFCCELRSLKIKTAPVKAVLFCGQAFLYLRLQDPTTVAIWNRVVEMKWICLRRTN